MVKGQSHTLSSILPRALTSVLTKANSLSIYRSNLLVRLVLGPGLANSAPGLSVLNFVSTHLSQETGISEHRCKERFGILQVVFQLLKFVPRKHVQTI